MSQRAPLDPTVKTVAIGRILLTLALIPLGRSWFSGWHEDIGFGLIRVINVAIHEFGHPLFGFFGVTAGQLGGSLFQVLFPMIFAGYFLFWTKPRDVHAATVCVWWAAMSLVEVAVYMHDARAGELMLINGQIGRESDGHDWYNLFETWGVLERDMIIAFRVRAVARVMFYASIVVGLFAAIKPLLGHMQKVGATPESA